MSHPELAAEQRYVDAAYARLDAMRASARRVAAGYSDVGRGGTHQARLEREAAEDLTRRRLAALDIGDSPLVFGRVDLDDDCVQTDAIGRTYYVGRLAVTDEEQVPLVVDWRAPVSEPFYRATAVESMGVVRRRHFLAKAGDGRELAGLDDEVFDQGTADESGLTIVGEGALLAALDRTRTGRMGDIVATIQAEQDEAIRAARRSARRRGWRRHRQDGGARCTARRTSSIRTGASSPRRACCSSGRARSSSGTSTRCCRHSARKTCSSRRRRA